MWKTYLDEVREEVLLGAGIFGEDEQLRGLLQECFDQGDALNGIVSWSESPPQAFKKSYSESNWDQFLSNGGWAASN